MKELMNEWTIPIVRQNLFLVFFVSLYSFSVLFLEPVPFSIYSFPASLLYCQPVALPSFLSGVIPPLILERQMKPLLPGTWLLSMLKTSSQPRGFQISHARSDRKPIIFFLSCRPNFHSPRRKTVMEEASRTVY